MGPKSGNAVRNIKRNKGQTHDRHVTKKHTAAVSGCIPYLTREPSSPKHHRILFDAPRDKTFVQPKMQRKIAVEESTTCIIELVLSDWR
jgi:hypothetical protein